MGMITMAMTKMMTMISGFVNTLLSWKALVPLSRLTYCIYLLHIMIMTLYLENAPALFYYSTLNIVSSLLKLKIGT